MDAAYEHGTRVGVYALGELIGEGGTSRVFRATHLTLGTDHAVKVLRADSRLSKERFLEEGRALSMLRHPNVIAVHAIVEEAGAVALVMEMVDGENLEAWRVTEAPPLRTRLRVFREIVAAVRELHRHGYVHRDLKPANVLMARVCGAPVPKLADLGIARRQGPRDGQHTLAGVTMGTPGYMPPEQIRDAATADARSDIFALGVMLYELVSGRLPFTSLDLERLHEAIVTRAYVPLDDTGRVPPHLGALVDRMLSPLPEDRPGSCDELLAALADTLGERTLRSGPAPIGVSSPRTILRATGGRRTLAFGVAAVAAGILGTAWTSAAGRRGGDVDAWLAAMDPPICEVAPESSLSGNPGPGGGPIDTQEREGGLRLFKKREERPPSE